MASAPYPNLGITWFFNVDPTTGPGVAAPLNVFGIRTDSLAIYYKSGAADTAWSMVGDGGSGGASSPVATGVQLQDFINDAGVDFVILQNNSGNAFAGIIDSTTYGASKPFIGTALLHVESGDIVQIAFDSPADGTDSHPGGQFCEDVSLAPFASEFRAKVSDDLTDPLNQTGLALYTGNLLGFLSDFTNFGNTNWWLSTPTTNPDRGDGHWDSGVPVDAVLPHRFRIVSDPATATVQWFIDDIQVLSKPFEPGPLPIGALAPFVSSLSTVGAGTNDVNVDYFWWTYDIDRSTP